MAQGKIQMFGLRPYLEVERLFYAENVYLFGLFEFFGFGEVFDGV